MYYQAPANGTAIPQEKQTSGLYIPSQNPFAAAQLPPGFAAPTQTVLPNGLTAAGPPTARYVHTPQHFAVVSTPGGHPPPHHLAAAPNIYATSMAYPGVAGIPTSSHAAAYLPTAQYPPGMGFQNAALATGRSMPPTQYAIPTPMQAGAPLFAAGYSPAVHAGIPGAATGARHLPIGPLPPGAALPPGYAFPTAAAPSSETAGPPMAFAPAGYVPQF